jgi:hypothetical protein
VDRDSLERDAGGGAVMRRAGWVMAVVAAAMLGGCGDDDPPIGCDVCPPPGYPALTTPQNTLEAMQRAYISRDSVETKQVYDANYVGTSTDLNDPPEVQVSTFRYADELAHIATMARSTTISSVLLDLGPSSSWTRLSSDDMSHPEWAVIEINAFHGEIYDGATLSLFTSSQPMTFTFIPTVAAPGDTTWKIIRWNEVGSSGT